MAEPDYIYQELVDASRRADLVIFEATPELSDRNIVRWPDPSDASGFVEAGLKAGASLLYIEKFSVGDVDVDAAANRLDVDHHLVREVAARCGETTLVTAKWVIQGIGHDLTVLPQWYEDLCDLIDAAADALADEDLAGQRARRESLVSELASLPGMATATNDAGRALVLDQHLQGGLQVLGGSTLMQEVKDYFNVHIRPALDQAVAAQAHQLLDENRSKKQVAVVLGIGATKLDQLLARYPKANSSS